MLHLIQQVLTHVNILEQDLHPYFYYLGNVYFADTLNNRIRKVTVSTGIITTYAGNGGSGGYSGDNGLATNAELYYPEGVAFDSARTHSLNHSFFPHWLIFSPFLTR